MPLAAIIIALAWLFILCFFIYAADGFFGKLDFTSNRLATGNLINILKTRNLQSGKFYDLGSCRGGLAKKIARTFPKLEVYGIDDSRFRTFVAKIRGRFLQNLQFKKQDIFSTNLTSANIVYLYLPQELMPELEIKLQKELKPGSLVISTAVSFPNWQPTASLILKKKKLFTYVKI